jgi:hypothetical protein
VDDPDNSHEISSNKSSASKGMPSSRFLNLLDLRLVLLGVCFYTFRAAVTARLLDMRRVEPPGEGEERTRLIGTLYAERLRFRGLGDFL